MVQRKHYGGALKQTKATALSVDGERTPAEVIGMMMQEGQDAVALKYVHKFKLGEQFPPEEIVRAVLNSSGELCVRTCAMLLKYVPLFGLESAFPMAQLLERVASSGVTVHEMDGRYVVKGRRRQVAQPGLSGGSHGNSPQPGTSPVTSGAGSAPS